MEVKGSAIKSIPEFITNKFCKEGHEKWLENLSVEAREVYCYLIVASNWYPLTTILVEPTRKMCELFYNGDNKGAWEAGRYSAEVGLKGIYKAFVQLGSAQFMLKKAGTIMTTFYRPSTIEVAESGKTNALLHITEFPEMDRSVELRIGGWMEKALEVSGCRNIKVDITKSLTKGDKLTEYTITWA
ncbi:MAG: hypothetical protein JW969_17590 [Spirochaetales bacterium]|nr:hypothetical protein [Spirochaetales bacterium]